MKRIFFFMLIVLISVSGKAQFGQGPQSKVVRDSIFSKVLNAQRQFTIYLPKSYEVNKDKKYPILYLLHGVYGIDQDWFLRGHAKDVADQLMASGEACEMIIVSPNAGGNPYAGDWNGYFDMPGWSYETFFYKEFLPYIESHYRVVGDNIFSIPGDRNLFFGTIVIDDTYGIRKLDFRTDIAGHHYFGDGVYRQRSSGSVLQIFKYI